MTSTTFELTDPSDDSNIDGSAFGSYHSGGQVRKAVTTVSGLWHLEGETVVATANGAAVTGLTVSGGSITLATAASRVHVGFPYTCTMKTLRLGAGELANEVHAKNKRIGNMTVMTERSRGFWFGPTEDRMKQLQIPAQGNLASFMEQRQRVIMAGDWNREGQIVIQQRDPLPLAVLSVNPDIAVGALP